MGKKYFSKHEVDDLHFQIESDGRIKGRVNVADGLAELNGAAKLPGANIEQSDIDHSSINDDEIDKHREINDGGAATTELWSSSKIASEVSAIQDGVDNKEGVETSTEGLGNITLSGEQTLNGILTSSSRILVKEQTNAYDNGLYITASGAWSRSSDADTSAKVTNGLTIWVTNIASAVYRHKYLLVTPDPITLGTTDLTFDELPDIEFGTGAGQATEGNDSRVPTQDENNALVGTSGTPSSSNKYVTNDDSRNTNARAPTAHDLGGAQHDADTLSNLNSKISNLIATYGGIRDVGVGTLAQRPAASVANRLWYATDKKTLSRDTGSTWESMAKPHRMGYSFTGTNDPYVSKSSATWVIMARFRFQGTIDWVVPNYAKLLAWTEAGKYWHGRIYDLTNAQVIASLTVNQTNTVPAIVSLGSLSNLPSAEAVMEVQMKGDGTFYTSAFDMCE